MTEASTIALIIIIINTLFSYKGFVSDIFLRKHEFEVDKILINRDYKRLVTSGFLHVGWIHLIFNMSSLYVFSGFIEVTLGGLGFLAVYFASLIGGNALSLFIHRNQGDYSAVGASGAICGIIFASIALFPGLGIGFFGLPFSIPSWLYGLLYIAYSIYGIKSRKDNIGHDAHLGGALIGMIVALAIEPSAFLRNYLTILMIAAPTIVFIYLIVTRPHVLLVDNLFYKAHKSHYSVDHRYNEEKRNRQKEIDRILDKITKKGINSLTKQEQEQLERYANK